MATESEKNKFRSFFQVNKVFMPPVFSFGPVFGLNTYLFLSRLFREKPVYLGYYFSLFVAHFLRVIEKSYVDSYIHILLGSYTYVFS